MAEVTEIGSQISEAYNQLILSLPIWMQGFVNILLLVVLVTIFCIFVWKVYRVIAKKDIIELNLEQYNQSSHPAITKFLSGIFYFIEYIIIMPFIVFFWFVVFTIFLIFLTEGIEMQTMLMISTVIIIAIRATAYYKEELSRELAKLLPFTLLAISMTKKGFFNFEEILTKFSQLPDLFGSILNFLIIIIILEVILRLFHFIFTLFGLEEEEED